MDSLIPDPRAWLHDHAVEYLKSQETTDKILLFPDDTRPSSQTTSSSSENVATSDDISSYESNLLNLATHLDSLDPRAARSRKEFYIPKRKHYKDTNDFEKDRPDLGLDKQESTADSEEGDEAIYFCGHSLGLQPRNTRNLVVGELNKWSRIGVYYFELL